MKIYDSATIICTKAFIIYITVTVPATSPCLHLVTVTSILSVSAFMFSVTTIIVIRIHVYNNVCYIL